MTERREECRQAALVWLEFAAADLAAAEILLRHNLLSSACFHAQQTAEKAFKAYLASLGEQHLPHTHHLARLAAAIAKRGGEAPSGEGIRKLSDYAASIRYPDAPPPEDTEAERAVRWAPEIYASGCGRVGK